MTVIGVTGGLASGKSEVAKAYRARGARVFDADESARKALKRGSPAYRAVLQLFGRRFAGPGGQLDRARLAAHVFTHPADLKKLNTLIHPGVIFDCLETIERLRSREGLLVLDVPLLYETRMAALADYVIVVSASRAECIRRAARKGIPPKLAARILATQWPASRKEKHADYVLRNDGTLDELKTKAAAVLREIREREAVNARVWKTRNF